MDKTAGAAIAMLCLLLAGCTQPNASSSQQLPEPSVVPPVEFADTSSEAPASPRQPGAPAPTNSSVEAEIHLTFEMTDCQNPRMLFVLDPDYAQSLLPPGFEPADVTALTQFTGAPVASPVEAGKAVAGYDFLSCQTNTLDGGPAAFSQVGVMVKAPDLGSRTPEGATMYDLYLLAVHADRPAWRDLLMQTRFLPAEVPASILNTTRADVALGTTQNTGSVVAGSPLASASYTLPSLGREIVVVARYWHVADNGTFYIDFRLDETVRAGTIESCDHAPGSVFEAVSRTTTCEDEARFAAVGVNTQVKGTLNWMPGVMPLTGS